MEEDIEFVVLGSSSKANLFALRCEKRVLLIDNGFSCREALRRLASIDVDPSQVCALLVTHAHTDHTRGAAVLARRLGIPVYMPRAMAESGAWKNITVFPVDAESPLEIGAFQVLPIRTYHDAASSLGYSLFCGSVRVTMITDTGKTDDRMTELAAASDLLCLESNYCEQMLANGGYPYILKRRLASGNGHLSNSESTALLQKIGPRTQHIFLCHLSGENNTPETVRRYLEDFQVPCRDRTVICSRDAVYRQQIRQLTPRRRMPI